MQLITQIKRDINLIELFRGSSVAFVFKFGGVLTNYILLFILAYIYGPKGVGVFSTSWTLLMITVVIAKLGFDSGIVKFMAEMVSTNRYTRIAGIYKKSVSLVLFWSLLISVVLYVSAPALSRLFYSTAADARFIRIMSFAVLPLALMQINAETLKGLKNIISFSYFQNGSLYLLTTIVLVLSLSYMEGYHLILYSLNAAIYLLLLLSFLAIRRQFRKIGVRLIGLSPRIGVRQLITVTLPMLFTNSLFLIMNWTDILMLSSLKDECAVGIYNTALKIAALNTVALIAINSIAAPKFAELFARGNLRALRRIVKQTSLLNTLGSLPVIILIVFFPDFLLSIFGEAFTEGNRALVLLGAGQFFSALSGSTLLFLNMTGHEKKARNIILLSTLLNIFLNYFLIINYGINGAAMATAISTVGWNIMAVLYIRHLFGFYTYPVLHPSKIREATKLLRRKKHDA